MANLNIPSTKDRTLDAFKGKMVGGGARPNLFECELFFPDDAIPINSSKDEIADKSRFLVKSAQLPASNIAPILVPFRGRNLKIAGDRTFDPWTITVINDVITRSNFLNVVDPFLRDVKAKRGITDYVVICDETNNTPDVIDSNQFRADIFVKPARSINFIGLTFVATRTGISFEEVVGNV